MQEDFKRIRLVQLARESDNPGLQAIAHRLESNDADVMELATKLLRLARHYNSSNVREIENFCTQVGITKGMQSFSQSQRPAMSQSQLQVPPFASGFLPQAQTFVQGITEQQLQQEIETSILEKRDLLISRLQQSQLSMKEVGEYTEAQNEQLLNNLADIKLQFDQRNRYVQEQGSQVFRLLAEEIQKSSSIVERQLQLNGYFSALKALGDQADILIKDIGSRSNQLRKEFDSFDTRLARVEARMSE